MKLFPEKTRKFFGRALWWCALFAVCFLSAFSAVPEPVPPAPEQPVSRAAQITAQSGLKMWFFIPRRLRLHDFSVPALFR